MDMDMDMDIHAARPNHRLLFSTWWHFLVQNMFANQLAQIRMSRIERGTAPYILLNMVESFISSRP